MARLAAHPWPGNVRELENCIEGAVVLTSADALDVSDLPLPSSVAAGAAVASDLATLTWNEMERRYIAAVLKDALAKAGVASSAIVDCKTQEQALDTVLNGLRAGDLFIAMGLRPEHAWRHIEAHFQNTTTTSTLSRRAS